MGAKLNANSAAIYQCQPLDVPSIKADISTQEIVAIVREGRERGQNPALHLTEKRWRVFGR